MVCKCCATVGKQNFVFSSHGVHPIRETIPIIINELRLTFEW